MSHVGSSAVVRSIFCAALLFLSACGSQAPGTSTDPAGGTSGVASLEITASRTSVPARAGETVDLTVTALDASRRALGSVPLTLQATSGIVTASATATDTSGKLTAQFGLGQDRSNRTVTVSANAGAIASTIAIDVTGTTLALSSNPSSVAGASATARLTARLLDANSQPIGGSAVTFGTNQGTLSTNTATTDATGVALVDISGISTAATVTAQAGNTSANVTINATGQGNAGLLPTGIVLRDFTVQANPAVFGTNQAGNTGNFSLIEARVTGAVGGTDNIAAQNAPVRFRLASAPPLGTLEINTATTPALTNATGLASNRLIAGANPSGTDAVIVCVGVDGLTPATAGNNAGTTCNAQEKAVRLTIAQQALFVRISFNNEIQKVDNNLNYEKLFSVVVTDAAGRGVPGIQVTPRLLPINYLKGNYAFLRPAAGQPGTPQWVRGRTDAAMFLADGEVVCPNEDTNFNGILDPTDQNTNNDANVWPGQAAAISIDNNGRTDATGFVIIRVKHGQRFATWATYQIEARAAVGGTEGRATVDYVLGVAAEDVLNENATPGFVLSPFGNAGACTNPN